MWKILHYFPLFPQNSSILNFIMTKSAEKSIFRDTPSWKCFFLFFNNQVKYSNIYWPKFQYYVKEKKLEPLNSFLATMRLTSDDKICEE